MPRVPYRYPAAGTDAIADAIRERRGARGLTPLDGMLLNAPSIAQGWNTLLGAVRTKNSLPSDVREIMILRVAARNRAAFEWIHHEHVAREAGVSEAQLTRIGDLAAPLSSSTSSGAGQLSALQTAALVYADAMTASVRVPDVVADNLQRALAESGASTEEVRQKFVEATATVATYNMVSRFLVACDVDDKASAPVPVPGLSTPSSSAGDLSYPETGYGPDRGLVQVPEGQTLATRVHFHSTRAPWLILVNSLMTNLTLWDDVLPALTASYNVITYDQRGHGASSVPSSPCTIAQLADDVAYLLSALGVDKVHAIIGVSQGGATALGFALRHPERVDRVIACDTQAASPAANAGAWDERIALARKDGMPALAAATLPRWYGPGSGASDSVRARTAQMVNSTPLEGFVAGARALQSYDLLSDGLVDVLKSKPTLLLAGEADGKLPETLAKLAKDVGTPRCEFKSVPKAGHLPMMDNPEAYARLLNEFLSSK